MSKAFFRLFNRIHVFLYRLTGGRFGGRIQALQVLLLTTTGRRTGQPRTVPLGSFSDDGAHIVIASNGGSDRHPGWFVNLKHEPSVKVQIGSETREAEARVVHGSERARLWQRLISLAPGYAGYERSTKREIPVVALTFEA